MKNTLPFGALLSFFLILLQGSASAQDKEGYRINSADTLRIEVIEDPSFNRTVLVGPDGRITIPLAGTFKVSDLTVEGIANQLAARIRDSFALSPTVIVTLEGVGQIGQIEGTGDLLTIFVIGEVNAPGERQLESGTTFLKALAGVGGFSSFAAVKRLQLRRINDEGREVIFDINYKDIVSGTSRAGMFELEDGDIILVPQRKIFE
jgi:polysaccharide export outer membrane protein